MMSSTDRSHELAKEFSEKESRIKVFRNLFEKKEQPEQGIHMSGEG